MQFVDAQVDKSLGNIRENIRKGAHQKHISTSIVDPLKEMKKSGKIQDFLPCFFKFSIPQLRSKRSRVKKNSPAQISGRIGKSQRNSPQSALVKREAVKSYYCSEVWLVVYSIVVYHVYTWLHCRNRRYYVHLKI